MDFLCKSGGHATSDVLVSYWSYYICCKHFVDNSIEELFLWQALWPLVYLCLELFVSGIFRRSIAPSTAVASLINRAKHTAYSDIRRCIASCWASVRSGPIMILVSIASTRAGLQGFVFLVSSIGLKVLEMSGCSVPGCAGLFPATGSRSQRWSLDTSSCRWHWPVLHCQTCFKISLSPLLVHLALPHV